MVNASMNNMMTHEKAETCKYIERDKVGEREREMKRGVVQREID